MGGAVRVSQSDPAGAANLEKVDHVVVLMLENRSFDHMLGYLSLAGARPEIDGLRPGLANQDHGRNYPVHHLARTALELDPAVRGATLPNRLYALCGGAAGSRDDRPPYVPPLYHQHSFVRYLDAHHVSWRWYSFDPGTLRLADVHYRLGHHHRFGYFSKTGLPWQTIFDITVNPKIPSFLEDAAAGTLRHVSWIDPAFTNFNLLGFPVNDDHPPADIKDGQDLVLAVYDALAASPQWDRSLLVIVYDENGGFYDHVPPPQAADDEPGMFGEYGVRVPAIIVSPWIEPRTVSHTLFDHTSIIKTILSRFCAKAINQPPQAEESHGLKPKGPGLRVAQANHLGELLTRTTPRPAPPRDNLVRQAVARAVQAKTGQAQPERPEEAEHPLNDLQKSILAATGQLRRDGHPPNVP
jgi:phospholipase C